MILQPKTSDAQMNFIGKNARQIWDRWVRLAAAITGRRLAYSGPLSCHAFFIIGSGRSGTTLLRRILSATDEVFVEPENTWMYRFIKAFEGKRHRSWTWLSEFLVDRLEKSPENKNFTLDYAILRRQMLEARPERRTLSTFFDLVYVMHARASGSAAGRWADKSPMQTDILDSVEKVFPNSRYIHIMRDGVDVVTSLVRNGIHDLDNSIDLWIRRTRAARELARKAPDRVHEVRYEDLVTDPENEVRRICAFTGMTYDAKMIDSTEPLERMKDVAQREVHENIRKPVSGEMIGKGRRELGAGDRDRIAERMNDALVEFSYEPLRRA